MKKYNYIYLILLIASILCFNSCDDFLDELPDSRGQLEKKEDVQKLLVSAYPEISYAFIAEISSDNTDDIGGTNNPNFDRFVKEIFEWEASAQNSPLNDDVVGVWEAYYKAIAPANEVLKFIEDRGFPKDLQAERAEALLCRAYAHFMLVNMFCQHYTKEFSETDLGIPYITTPETTLNPQYERGTVAGVYKLIEKDLLDALPIMSDEYYNVSKYHFNTNAAHAFAARFYLYYQDFDKAIEYATKALGNIPESILRDNVTMDKLPRNPMNTVCLDYVDAKHKCNFLLMSHYSGLGVVFNSTMQYSRYNHSSITSNTESITYAAPWGKYADYYLDPWVYEATNLDKVLLPRFPYIIEYTDPIAGSGYARTVQTVFTAEETLLTRAEAYALKKDYTNALKDMNMWIKSTRKNAYTLTEDGVNNWIGVTGEYYQPLKPTPKKKLNPEFQVEAGFQENLIHVILFARRYETLHTGLRWFDVKRYGIVLDRRRIAGGRVAEDYNNRLDVRDPRRAIQIPIEAIQAGLEPNPRP